MNESNLMHADGMNGAQSQHTTSVAVTHTDNKQNGNARILQYAILNYTLSVLFRFLLLLSSIENQNQASSSAHTDTQRAKAEQIQSKYTHKPNIYGWNKENISIFHAIGIVDIACLLALCFACCLPILNTSQS